MTGKTFLDRASIVFIRAIAVFMLLALSSCSSSCTKSAEEKGGEEPTNPPTQLKELTAYFDYFTYKGNDDFYNENPLTSPEQFYNPILPGWYSDPSVCTNGKDYFLVTSTFIYYPGVPIFHSTDMMNWRQIGHVLDRPGQLVNFQGQGTSGGIFAPTIEYNPHNQTYYMITTNVGAGNFFVKTKDPFGAWSDPIWLPDVHGIDPSFFFDDDGKGYVLHNGDPDEILYEGHKAIRMLEFDVATEKTIGESVMVINGGVDLEQKPIWIEAPHLYKVKDKYLLMAAEGGTGGWHSEVIFKGGSPMGPFVPWDKNPMLTQRLLDGKRPNPITCVGHADIVETSEGDWWGVFLGCRPIDSDYENLGRETFAMPVKWSDDGFPYMTQGEDLVPMVIEREGVVRGDKVLSGNFEITDNFDGEKLTDEWIYLRSSAENLYSLTELEGFLALKCADVTTMEFKTPAFVCRRIQHHKFEATTRLYYEPQNAKESAGIMLYKDETHQYYMSVTLVDDKRVISLEKVNKSGSTTLESKNLNNNDSPIDLKVISHGNYFDFYYAIDGGKWKMLCQNIDAHYLSTANCGGFTGTTIGMYATQKRL